LLVESRQDIERKTGKLQRQKHHQKVFGARQEHHAHASKQQQRKVFTRIGQRCGVRKCQKHGE